MKATVSALITLLASSAHAFAHSGHVPVVGSPHAVQHVTGDWLAVAMALVALGAGAMIAAGIRGRDRVARARD